jgi:hypothetical protein
VSATYGAKGNGGQLQGMAVNCSEWPLMAWIVGKFQGMKENDG